MAKLNKIILVFLLVACATAALAIGASGRGNSGEVAAVTPLRVHNTVMPRLPGVRHYKTHGTYPQFSGGGVSLRDVNQAIRNVIVSEQIRYARKARRQQRRYPAPPHSGPGHFATSLSVKLMSASSVVVSVLIRLTERFPAGTDGQLWLPVTVKVPDGSAVKIADLFSDPKAGLSALASAARSRLMIENKCVKDSLNEPDGGDFFATHLQPTSRNFGKFALTAEGLAIGFNVGVVAHPYCNRVEVTVPYAEVSANFSDLGRQLAEGALAPTK